LNYQIKGVLIMAFCSNCGAQIEEGAASCPVCGTVIYNHISTPETKPEYYTPPTEAPQPQAQYTPPQQQYAQPQQQYAQPQQNQYTQPAQQYAQPQQNQYYQPQPQQQNYYYQQQGVNSAQYTALRNNANSAKTMGILAIIFAFFWQLLSFIFGGIGISKANDVMAQAQALGDQALYQEAAQAKSRCKTGIILSVVFIVLALIFVIVAAAIGVAQEM
jgi:hypothetical protein